MTNQKRHGPRRSSDRRPPHHRRQGGRRQPGQPGQSARSADPACRRTIPPRISWRLPPRTAAAPVVEGAATEPRRAPGAPPRGAAAQPEHHRAEGHEHPGADAGGQGPERGRRHRHAQAGPDLPDPQGAGGAERPDLLRGRAGTAARRLRVPALARLQLPAGPRRHLRVVLADPPVRPAYGRYRVRPDPSAAGRGALFLAGQGRGGELRAAGPRAREDLLREPDAAVPRPGRPSRDDQRQSVGARDGSDDAARKGPAGPHRVAPADGQDDAPAEHGPLNRRKPPRGRADRAADRRAARKR